MLTLNHRFAMRSTIFSLLVFSGAMAHAANWYVSKAASGSNNGTSWTNAWTEMSSINYSSVACGDTIWLAGGSYTSVPSVGKTCTAGTLLLLKRVLSTDSVPVAAAGWQSSLASQVVFTNKQMVLAGSYWTLDGRVGDANTNVPYGIYFNNTTDGWLGVIKDPGSGNVLGITISHVEVHGPACVTSGSCSGGGANWALALQNGSHFDVTMDHDWLHQFGEVIHGPTGSSNNMVIQYSYIGEDVKLNSEEHEDWLYTAPPCAKMTFIGDRWYSSGNDGIFIDYGGCTSGFVMINNIFDHWGGWAASFGKTGTCGPYTLFNNTFGNDGLGSDGNGNEYTYGFIQSGGCTLASSSIAQNNIFVNTDLGSFNNAPNNTANIPTSTANSKTTPYFVNFVPAGTNSQSIVTADFHLTATGASKLQAGANLTSMCSTYPALCTDLDGNARPTTGAWYQGAYTYGASTTPPPPPPPQTSACDVTGDGQTNTADVQKEVNMDLQIIPCTNPSGLCTVAQVQRVVNAALGGACVTP